MTEKASLFVVGAKVYVSHGGWNETYSEDTVEKVYKNGNFKISKSDRQWHPYGRHASLAGRNDWSRQSLMIADTESDAIVANANATARRIDRLNAIKDKVAKLKILSVTDELLSAIEAALTSAQASPAFHPGIEE